MRLEGWNDGEGPIVLVLSRRNLETGLEKLDMPGSARTLIGGTGAEGFVVMFEEDDEHYGHECRKGAPPGPVLRPDGTIS